MEKMTAENLPSKEERRSEYNVRILREFRKDSLGAKLLKTKSGTMWSKITIYQILDDLVKKHGSKINIKPKIARYQAIRMPGINPEDILPPNTKRKRRSPKVWPLSNTEKSIIRQRFLSRKKNSYKRAKRRKEQTQRSAERKRKAKERKAQKRNEMARRAVEYMVCYKRQVFDAPQVKVEHFPSSNFVLRKFDVSSLAYVKRGPAGLVVKQEEQPFGEIMG